MRVVDFLGYWCLTPLSGHYAMPTRSERGGRCDARRLARLLGGDEAAARGVEEAWHAFPRLSSADMESNNFWAGLHKASRATARTNATPPGRQRAGK